MCVCVCVCVCVCMCECVCVSWPYEQEEGGTFAPPLIFCPQKFKSGYWKLQIHECTKLNPFEI